MQATATNRKAARRRRRTTVIAAILALILLLSGTFAWQSISQQARNPAMGRPGPAGGRLHDDFEVMGADLGRRQWIPGAAANKDVYVENFEEDQDDGEGNRRFNARDIFVRIRMYEYMEIGEGANLRPGDPGFDERLAGGATDGAVVPLIEGSDRTDWVTWAPRVPIGSTWDAEATANSDLFRSKFQWTMGGQKYFMPTFNRDWFSLMSDTKGNAVDPQHAERVAAPHNEPANPTRSIAQGGAAPHAFPAAETPGGPDAGSDGFFTGASTHTSYYKYWSHNDFDIEIGTHAISTETRTHTAQPTLSATVMTMYEWLLLPATDREGHFWVIDEDGWAYWAAPLEPGDATGLLLDEITLIGNIFDEWYYGIHIDAQMSTAYEWYSGAQGFGWFYNEERAPSENASTLMRHITGAVGRGVIAETWQGGITGDGPAGPHGTFTDSSGMVWRVLAMDAGNNALIVAEHVRDVGRLYNTTNAYSRLGTSNLRTELNTFWLSVAPEIRERALAPLNVEEDGREDNNATPAFAAGEQFDEGMSRAGTGPADPAANALFILSTTEANRYFNANTGAQGRAAFAPGTTTPGLAWWLRSPGTAAAAATNVGTGGAVAAVNANVITVGIRPAMWVSTGWADGEAPRVGATAPATTAAPTLNFTVDGANTANSMTRNTTQLFTATATLGGVTQSTAGVAWSIETTGLSGTSIAPATGPAATLTVGTAEPNNTVVVRATFPTGDVADTTVHLSTQANIDAVSAAGQTFRDTNGMIWRTLAVTGVNTRLIMSEHVYGHGTSFNGTDAWGAWGTMDISTALSGWWTNVCPVLQARALTADGTTPNRSGPLDDDPNWDAAQNFQPLCATSPGALSASASALHLLSLTDVNWRMTDTDSARQAFDVSDGTTARAWWLRCPGNASGTVSYIAADGSRGTSAADNNNVGFRPVLWIGSVS